MSGQRNKAVEIVKKMETTEEYVTPGESAILYIALGEKDRAFVQLEKAYAERDMQLAFLNQDFHFESLYDDPRFKDLLRRVGLPL